MTASVSGSRRPLEQPRRVRYRWRLREVMALHGLFMTTDLAPLLASRGITLSPSQIHRIVVGTPERMSMPVLAALCDIFQTDPNDLIVIDSEPAKARPGTDPSDTDADTGPDAATELAARRPTRARITPAPTPAPRPALASRPGARPGARPGSASDVGPRPGPKRT